jgi:cell division protein FtsQ
LRHRARKRGDRLAKLRAIDIDAFPQEVLADEEPKYLRRQKPLEIKRRKFGRKAWKTYLRTALWMGAGVAGVWIAYNGGRFLLAAPEMQLIHPEQVEISGTHFVPRANVLEIFAADRGKSILRIPIDQRRGQLESIAWVGHATVRRALPKTLQVEITERVPVAFLRQANDMFLIDAHGVILERPLRADFSFPVVTGISAEVPLDERQKRMQLFTDFSRQLEDERPGAMDQVSEIDLSQANDLAATIDGLPKSAGDSSWLETDGPVVVHFGDTDFGGKYGTLLDDIGQWRAAAGHIESVDLRFSREAVVNPEMAGAAPSSLLGTLSPRSAPSAEQPPVQQRAKGVRSSRVKRKQGLRRSP